MGNTAQPDAHTATLVDSTAWILGGCDDEDSAKDIYCLDTDTVGDIPPPFRAHTATLFDRKSLVFGGDLRSKYFDTVYLVDIPLRRWSKPHVEPGPKPPRRYHTANLVGSIMVVIGGSDGKDTFTEVWCLDLDKLIWTALTQSSGPVFPKRLAHSATKIGSFLFVMRGH
ncbi:hypothetical protein D9613_003735 [Agrocybe pediades]|uniref:Uncharacterized protein n=1 Tax=Agrocybe pediades TaxID=84607 RepID=A0A8H4QJ03_9AGAR|nr:hypothetical protein D9613_003735 [Agrocybe pediades]